MWQELHLEPTLLLAALHDRLWPTMLEPAQVRLLSHKLLPIILVRHAMLRFAQECSWEQ